MLETILYKLPAKRQELYKMGINENIEGRAHDPYYTLLRDFDNNCQIINIRTNVSYILLISNYSSKKNRRKVFIFCGDNYYKILDTTLNGLIKECLQEIEARHLLLWDEYTQIVYSDHVFTNFKNNLWFMDADITRPPKKEQCIKATSRMICSIICRDAFDKTK